MAWGQDSCREGLGYRKVIPYMPQPSRMQQEQVPRSVHQIQEAGQLSHAGRCQITILFRQDQSRPYAVLLCPAQTLPNPALHCSDYVQLCPAKILPYLALSRPCPVQSCPAHPYIAKTLSNPAQYSPPLILPCIPLHCSDHVQLCPVQAALLCPALSYSL